MFFAENERIKEETRNEKSKDIGIKKKTLQ